VIAGITVAAIVNVMIRFIIFSVSNNSLTFGLSTTALWVGIVFGLVMPLISILIPIK